MNPPSSIQFCQLFPVTLVQLFVIKCKVSVTLKIVNFHGMLNFCWHHFNWLNRDDSYNNFINFVSSALFLAYDMLFSIDIHSSLNHLTIYFWFSYYCVRHYQVQKFVVYLEAIYCFTSLHTYHCPLGNNHLQYFCSLLEIKSFPDVQQHLEIFNQYWALLLWFAIHTAFIIILSWKWISL